MIINKIEKIAQKILNKELNKYNEAKFKVYMEMWSTVTKASDLNIMILHPLL